MKREIEELREVIQKLVPLLSGQGLTVTQRGSQAYVSTNPRTKKPEVVNIPNISDNADAEFIRAIQGFIDHEVAHVLITDWNHYGGDGGVSAAQLRDPKVRQFMNTHNIVEDTMIEREMIKRFPGSERNISDTRKWFLQKITAVALKTAKTPKEQFIYLMVPAMRALAGHVEMQDFMAAGGYWSNEYVDALKSKLKPETLELLKTCTSTKETLEIAKEVHAIIYPPAPPKPPETPKPPKPPKPPEPPKPEEEKKSEDKPEKEADEGDGDGERDHKDTDDEGEKGEADETKDEDEDDGEAEEEPDDEDGSDGSDGEPADEDDAGSSGDVEPDEDPAGEDGRDGSDEADDDAEDPDAEDLPDEPEDDDAGLEDEAGDDDDPEHDAEPDADEGDDDGASGFAGGSSDPDEPDFDDEEDEGDHGSSLTRTEGDDGGGVGDIDREEDEDPEGGNGGGVGNEGGKSIFDFTEDAFDEADMSSQISILISEEAVLSMDPKQYNVFTRELDQIQPIEPPEKINDKWVPKMEDETRAMTGRMRKDIERIMASQSHVIRTPGHKSGRLHGSSLWRVPQNDPRVFSQRQEHVSKDTAVTLLVDNSGSMAGEKMRLATLASYALSSTLDAVKIKHEVIGFTAGGFYNVPATLREAMSADMKRSGINYDRIEPIIMPIYKEFDERITALVKKRFAYMMFAQHGLNGNIDGESLEYAAARLIRRSEKRKVMIVLSDGQPAGSAKSGPHLKYVVQNLEKQGIECIGIGIKDRSVAKYYPKHVVLHDAAQLPNEVMTAIKKILL